MGISTLRRHGEAEVQDVQPGLISREDHERIVADLEERYGNEIATLRKQVEERQLNLHELSDFQKKELLERRKTRNPDEQRADPSVLAQGGESVQRGAEGRTTVHDAKSGDEPAHDEERKHKKK